MITKIIMIIFIIIVFVIITMIIMIILIIIVFVIISMIIMIILKIIVFVKNMNDTGNLRMIIIIVI